MSSRGSAGSSTLNPPCVDSCCCHSGSDSRAAAKPQQPHAPTANIPDTTSSHACTAVRWGVGGSIWDACGRLVGGGELGCSDELRFWTDGNAGSSSGSVGDGEEAGSGSGTRSVVKQPPHRT